MSDLTQKWRVEIDPMEGLTVYPRTIIAIDPGDKFTGVAFFHNGECYQTALYEDEDEVLYGNLVYWLALHLVDAIVVETFELYPDKLQQQGYSKMLTPRRIGVLQYLAAIAKVPYHEQKASIKRATRAIMRAKGIKHVGEVVHTKDAELHGYYFINNKTGRRRAINGSR